jgi:hypothetical protein
MSTLLGGKPREAIARRPATPEQEPSVTGWTQGEFLPYWIAACAYGVGVLVRKVWVYVCAPIGALGMVMAFLLSR